MSTFVVLFAVVGVTLVLLSLATLRKHESREWKILSFLSFFLLPAMFAVPVSMSSFEHMKTTEFCGSCHPMAPYIESLTTPTDKSGVGWMRNGAPDAARVVAESVVSPRHPATTMAAKVAMPRKYKRRSSE